MTDSPAIVFNDDQQQALTKIEGAIQAGEQYLLTGNAGTGKTTLMQGLADRVLSRHKSIVFTAPTHKAVSVLARKMREANLQVECKTIHSLLSLKPKPHGDQLVFERDRRAPPVFEDVVVVDECSMVDESLFRHIKRHLPNAFVLFVGDPAQLPPVGEVESHTFAVTNRAHLTTVVRQAADNPILDAAGRIRQSQGSAADWSWLHPLKTEDGRGIFFPKDAKQFWMKKAFTSDDFEENPDTFRYLAWTNQRVREINGAIRHWRYGDHIPTPFMPGERAMFRSPLVIDGNVIFATNEEATVVDIRHSIHVHTFPKDIDVTEWQARLPSWQLTLRSSLGECHEVHMVEDEKEFNRAVARVKDEAADNRYRWKHLHDFKSSIAHLQSIYAQTVHTAQGATYGSVFCDIPDIRRREGSNLLEMQQLLYTAVTRPTHRVIVV